MSRGTPGQRERESRRQEDKDVGGWAALLTPLPGIFTQEAMFLSLLLRPGVTARLAYTSEFIRPGLKA